MKDVSKAAARRARASDFTTRFLVGQGLDIGNPADPLGQHGELFPAIRGIRHWDLADGDAQYLKGLADESFDFVHACHILALLADPKEALRHWFRVLKPGGHLVLLEPDEDMYEQGYWPSRYCPEHRASFTIFKARSWCPASVNMTELIQALGPQADVQKLELVAQGFRHRLPRFDQTLTPVAESAIELVVRKRTQAEASTGGRLAREAPMTAADIFILTGRAPGKTSP
jgi:SAM-dependent methyltransferase